jgi:hypothetical protein
VDGFGRDHQALAGADPCRWLAVDVVLQRSFQDVDDLFTRVLVPKERRGRADVDAVLDDLASRNAEVALLDIGAPESLRPWNGAAHLKPPWVLYY